VTLIVPSGEAADNLASVHHLIAPTISDLLMATNHHTKSVTLEEFICDVTTELMDQLLVVIPRRGVHAKRILDGLRDWVGPKHIVDNTVGGELGVIQRPFDVGQIREVPIAISDTPVNDQDTLPHDAPERQPFKGCTKGLKHFCSSGRAKPLFALSLETPISAIHDTIFVVAPIDLDIVRKGNFERKHQAYDFQLVLPTVNPVTVKDEGLPMRVGKAKVVEEQEEVPELSVEIAVNFRWKSRLVECVLILGNGLHLSDQLQYIMYEIVEVVLLEERC
jgi:hypothetical protein